MGRPLTWRQWTAALATATVVSVSGCDTEHAPLERASVPMGGRMLTVKTSGITAGPLSPMRAVRSPVEGNVHAIGEGLRVYRWFNCDGCHGSIGGGSIGPPLRDDSWIYGGRPENIYQSILQGRPQGMPAFLNRIPEEQLWKLVAYVQSLGGGDAGHDEEQERGSVAAEPEKAARDQPDQPDQLRHPPEDRK